MQLIKRDELKPHESNDYFFDDITGDNWTEFLKSVESSGVIEPVIITQNKVIVSGHQRVRACEELKIDDIPCEIRIYESEEKILKDLLETNLRQRGIGNTNPVKLARCILELEKIYGIQHGGVRDSNGDNLHLKTQSELAEQFDMSERQLRDYKKLLTLIPELQDLIEDGNLSPTVGYKVLAKLSKEEQEKLIGDFGAEYISSLTQKKAQELITDIKQEMEDLEKGKEDLEKDYNTLQKENEKLEVELEQALDKKTVVDNTDYGTIESLKEQLSSKELEKRKLEVELSNLRNQKVETHFGEKEVDKPETLEKIKSLENELSEVSSYVEKYKNVLNEIQEKDAIISRFMGESTNFELINSTSEITLKMLEFLKEMSKYDYLATVFNDIPDATRKEYMRSVYGVYKWARSILNEVKIDDVLGVNSNNVEIIEYMEVN